MEQNKLVGMSDKILKEKTYYLIYICFGEHYKNTYAVYKYRKSRRFTVKQQQKFLYSTEGKIKISEGVLPGSATVETYWDIIKKLGLNEKDCDSCYNFGYLKKLI